MLTLMVMPVFKAEKKYDTIKVLTSLLILDTLVFLGCYFV